MTRGGGVRHKMIFDDEGGGGVREVIIYDQSLMSNFTIEKPFWNRMKLLELGPSNAVSAGTKPTLPMV